jgi:hypothetical protein
MCDEPERLQECLRAGFAFRGVERIYVSYDKGLLLLAKLAMIQIKNPWALTVVRLITWITSFARPVLPAIMPDKATITIPVVR